MFFICTMFMAPGDTALSFKWRSLHYILTKVETTGRKTQTCVCVGGNPPAFLLIVLSECTLIINSNYVLAARILFCCYASYSIMHVSCGVYSGLHSSVRCHRSTSNASSPVSCSKDTDLATQICINTVALAALNLSENYPKSRAA